MLAANSTSIGSLIIAVTKATEERRVWGMAHCVRKASVRAVETAVAAVHG